MGQGGAGVGEFLAENEGFVEGGRVILDLARVFGLVYKKICEVSHIDDVEVVFHRKLDGVEHFFAFRAADGDDHSAAVAAFGFDERFFEDVLVCPQALAAVDEELGLSGDGHKEYGCGEDEAVCVEHFLQDYLIVVVDAAATRFVAGVTFDARRDIVIREAEIFGLGVGGDGAFEGTAKEQVAIAF